MELLYIYIDDDKRNIKRCGFNLSPKYHFDYDHKTKKLTKINLDYITNFWGAKNINNITAIIGKNGSGKSNLLEHISLALCGGLSGRGYTLLVWKYNGVVYVNQEIIADFEIREFDRFMYSPMANIADKGISDSLLLYYSSSLDKKVEPKSHRTKNFVDISTGNLARKVDSYDIRKYRYSDVDYMQTIDVFKQMLFLSNYESAFLPSNITIPEYLEVQFYWYNDFRQHPVEDGDSEFEKKLKGVLCPSAYGVDNHGGCLYDELISLYNSGNIKCLIPKQEGLMKGKRVFKVGIRRTAITNKFATTLMEYYFQQGYNNATFSSLEFSKDTINNNCIINWDGLSSGEVSFYTLLSRIFSILRSKLGESYNVQTGEVHINSRLKSKHKNIILILDEPELSFHPEWQQKFIDLLIGSLANVFKAFKFQVIIASHSPIIVSDFPNNNIVFLKRNDRGMCEVVRSIGIENTFAANIHSLYRNNFFLDGLPIGDFAKGKIKQLFGYLNRDYTYPTMLQEINNIGEPLIKEQLLSLYKDKCSKQQRIYMLEQELRKLKESND